MTQLSVSSFFTGFADLMEKYKYSAVQLTICQFAYW